MPRARIVVALTVAACAGAESTTSGIGSAPVSDVGGDELGTTTVPPVGTDWTETGVDDQGDADTSAGTDPTSGDPVDLEDGHWELENVSRTPIMGFHPKRVLTEDGREVVAWAETFSAEDSSTLNIVAALRQGGEWTKTTLTSFEGVQNTFPTLVAQPAPILAWSGSTEAEDDDDDIWMAVLDGGSWQPPQNISDALELAIESRADRKPSLIGDADTGYALAFISAELVGGALDPTPQVIVSDFLRDEDPNKRSIVIDSSVTSCTDVVGASAPSGVFHFVLPCTVSGTGTLLQVTNRSGMWTSDELAGLGTAILSPQMASGRDGVHLVWVQSQPCGDDTCSEIWHARTQDEVFGTPVQVTDQINLDERKPAVGVDPWGRVIVLHQALLDGNMGIYLSLSDDGETFAELGRISPAASPDSYQSPTQIVFDDEGRPSFALEMTEDGSDPLNVEIFVARFVPN
jgi:hypothetical protein